MVQSALCPTRLAKHRKVMIFIGVAPTLQSGMHSICTAQLTGGTDRTVFQDWMSKSEMKWQRLKVGLFRSCWIGTLKCSILQAQKFGDDINHFSLLYSIQLHPIALFHLPNASHAKVVKTSGTPSISRSIPAFVIMQDFGNGFYQSLEAANYSNSLQNLIVSVKIQTKICWNDISKQSPKLDVGDD